jgi:ribosomal protein S18 acetylase RimI-like enzyme
LGHPPILVTRLGAAQRQAAIATLSDALRVDPWKRWALAPERFEELLVEGNAMGVDEALGHDELWGAGDVEAVACWSPPQTREERLAEIETWWDPGRAEHYSRPLEDIAELERLTVATLSEGPFWYLEVLGTRTGAQRRGLASALLQPALARCEREGVAAAVDTANPQAVSFYERLSFRLLGSVSHAGSPQIWVLAREP